MAHTLQVEKATIFYPTANTDDTICPAITMVPCEGNTVEFVQENNVIKIHKHELQNFINELFKMLK